MDGFKSKKIRGRYEDKGRCRRQRRVEGDLYITSAWAKCAACRGLANVAEQRNRILAWAADWRMDGLLLDEAGASGRSEDWRRPDTFVTRHCDWKGGDRGWR
jgi:hypothetical protein